jgi:hypothetical protein
MSSSTPLSNCLVLPVFDLDSDPAESFSFLLEFTKDISLPQSFENGSAVVSKALVRHAPILDSPFDDAFENLFAFDLDGLSWTEGNLGLGSANDLGAGIGTVLWPNPPQFDLDEQKSSQADRLASKAEDIMHSIRLHSNTKAGEAGYSLIGSSQDNIHGVELFTAPQIGRYLDLYWEMWYPNWPTIHRPLFDPTTAASLLVAAMVVMGACHSDDVTERAAAAFWAVALEEWALRELDKISSERLGDSSRNAVQIIQASCIICIHQNWNGTTASKCRMRRKFFAAIVGVSDLTSIWLIPSRILTE